MMFAILFGLSMDYEVFLLSRVREEYLRTGDKPFSPATQPEAARRSGRAGLLDDLTVTRDGTVYVADWASGKVYQIDLDGAVCEIASDLPQVTAVEPGQGRGFSRGHLYVSSHAGTIYELQPPRRGPLGGS